MVMLDMLVRTLKFSTHRPLTRNNMYIVSPSDLFTEESDREDAKVDTEKG